MFMQHEQTKLGVKVCFQMKSQFYFYIRKKSKVNLIKTLAGVVHI